MSKGSLEKTKESEYTVNFLKLLMDDNLSLKDKEGIYKRVEAWLAE